MEYLWIIIGDRAGLGLDGLGLGWTIERGSGCICLACVDWGPSIAVDGSQVTELLSWAHTCLWEREKLLLSCHEFWLFLDRRLRVDYWVVGLSTALRPDLRCWGLGVPAWTGIWTHWQEWNGLVLFVPGDRWDVCFGVLSYIDSRITISIWRYNLAMV
jgi:hypothetical protein